MSKKFWLKLIMLLALLVCTAWLSLNWAKGQPYFSNPFADESLSQKLKDDAQGILKSGSDQFQRAFN